MQNEGVDWIWVNRRAGWTEVLVYDTADDARRSDPRRRECAWHRRLGNVVVDVKACPVPGFKTTPYLSLAAIQPTAEEIVRRLEEAARRGQLS